MCGSVLGQSQISQLSGVSLVRVVSAVLLVAACLVSLENSWHVRQGLQEDGRVSGDQMMLSSMILKREIGQPACQSEQSPVS